MTRQARPAAPLRPRAVTSCLQRAGGLRHTVADLVLVDLRCRRNRQVVGGWHESVLLSRQPRQEQECRQLRTRLAGELGKHVPRGRPMPRERTSEALVGTRVVTSSSAVGFELPSLMPTPAERRPRRSLACLMSSTFPPCSGGWRPTLPNARSTVRCIPECPGSTSEGQGMCCRHRPPSG
jgi:hypothetical protein